MRCAHESAEPIPRLSDQLVRPLKSKIELGGPGDADRHAKTLGNKVPKLTSDVLVCRVADVALDLPNKLSFIEIGRDLDHGS